MGKNIFIKSTAHIPFYIWFIAVVFFTLMDFFYSPHKGSLLIFDAIVHYVL
ncbi:MAG: hypothetical protein ACPKMZ_01860 [Pleomorphochaeta sp.]